MIETEIQDLYTIPKSFIANLKKKEKKEIKEETSKRIRLLKCVFSRRLAGTLIPSTAKYICGTHNNQYIHCFL